MTVLNSFRKSAPLRKKEAVIREGPEWSWIAGSTSNMSSKESAAHPTDSRGGREPVTIPNETASCGFCGAFVVRTGFYRSHNRPDGTACTPGIPLGIRY